MEQKPGTTRLAFIIICSALVVLAVPVILFAVRSPVADVKDIANVAIGAVIGALGTAVAFYFVSK